MRPNEIAILRVLSGNSTVTCKNGYYYLSLESVTEEDVGEYEAIASNSRGQVKKIRALEFVGIQ